MLNRRPASLRTPGVQGLSANGSQGSAHIIGVIGQGPDRDLWRGAAPLASPPWKSAHFECRVVFVVASFRFERIGHGGLHGATGGVLLQPIMLAQNAARYFRRVVAGGLGGQVAEGDAGRRRATF